MAGGGNGRSNGDGPSEQHQNSPDPDWLKAFEFKPGQSGNPAGRPKGAKDGLRATLRKRLKSAPEGMMADVLKTFQIDPTDKQNADVIIDVLMYKIAGGDIQALKLVFDQTEEPLKRAVELSGEGGGPIELQVSDARNRLMEDITRGLEEATGNGKAEHP